MQEKLETVGLVIYLNCRGRHVSLSALMDVGLPRMGFIQYRLRQKRK